MRAWNEFVARLGDAVPVPLLGLVLFLAAGLAALLWYWWPEWFHRLRRLRGWRWRGFRRRRGRSTDEPAEPAGPEESDGPDDVAPDALPDLPAGALTLNADDLAAQGRFKEAVRERLRAIVRDLVERGVIDNHPGWTVTELAERAGHARPACAPPLASASDVFSRIWYGQRPATAGDDDAMRRYVERVRAALAEGRVPA